MPFSADLLYQVYQQERNNPAYAGMDDNAFADQFLKNAINSHQVDGGTLTQLAQMVNPSMYAQNADFAPAAAANNFSDPRWANLNAFSNNARAAVDASDGFIGNNVPTQGGMMDVTGSGASATVTPQTGANSGWQFAQGVPVPASLQSQMAQLGTPGTFNPQAMLQNRAAPTGSASMAVNPLQIQAPQQFQMPQAPGLPQFQGSPLNIERPNAPALPNMPQIGSVFNDIAAVPRPAMNTTTPGPLYFERPNAPQPLGDLSLPGVPGAVQAPTGGLARPQGPAQVGDIAAPNLPSAIDAPSASLNRPQGPQSVQGSLSAPSLSALMAPAAGINRPQGPAGVVDPSLAGYSRNPGIDQALDTLQRRIGTMRDEGLQAARSNAVAVGGLGGSRQGVVERGVIQDANNSFADAAGQLLYQDFNDAQNRNLDKYGKDIGLQLGKGQLGQTQFGTEADLAAADATLRNQQFDTLVNQNLGLSGIGADLFKSDQANAIDRTGLNLQRYSVDADLAKTEAGLGLDRFNALVGQNTALGQLANDRYGRMADFAVNRGGLDMQRYATDADLASTEGQLGQARYATQVQDSLGRGGLAQQQLGTLADYGLGRGNINAQLYGQQLDYDLGRANTLNARYANDIANTSQLNNFAADVYRTGANLSLGSAGLANDRLGLQTQQALGLGGLQNQRLGMDRDFSLGIGNLQNQANQQNMQYALGLGGLAQQGYGTAMTGALGQLNAGTNRYLAELGYNNNVANTQIAADRARNDFFTAQRGQDISGALAGATLQQAEQDFAWNPVKNAANIFAGFNGLGTQVSSGSGGGLGGALWGALGGAALGGQMGFWGK